MAGHRLEIGEHGDISYRELDGRVTASFYYRNNQGRRRRIEATASTKAAARRSALASLERALSSAGVGAYSQRTTFREVAEHWFQQMQEMVAGGRRSPATVEQYRHMLDRHILPEIGGLRLHELTVARMDHFIHEKRRMTGYATAKLCRSVASGICGFAVRREALRFNPVRDVSALEVDAVNEARALTLDECREWLAILEADEHAVRTDLPDLVRFLLGTGCRLGEALGVRWEDVDLERQVVHVRRTVIRVTGQGLIVKRPKSQTGVRVLRMSLWLVGVLRSRQRKEGPVFPDARGGYRDRNNVERDFRTVRKGTPFEWVVPHTYRKTVATLLDQQGLTARVIADQLGHSRISMTQDVYLGRRVVDEAAASALEAFGNDDDPDDDDPPTALSAVG